MATHSVNALGTTGCVLVTSKDPKDKGLLFNGGYKALSQCHPNRKKRRARTKPPAPTQAGAFGSQDGWGWAGEPPRLAVKPFQSPH